MPHFGRYASVRGLGFVPIESPLMTSQYLSIQSFALSPTVWSEFQCQIVTPPKFDPPSPFGGYRVGPGIENGTN